MNASGKLAGQTLQQNLNFVKINPNPSEIPSTLLILRSPRNPTFLQIPKSTMAVKTIGLSGPSSSGKTTVSHLLQRIFPNVVYILHADDFCKEFDQIPAVNRYLDCDSPDAVDFERMAHVLDHMKSHDGIPPEDFQSWQDDVFPGQEEKALKGVSGSLIEGIKLELKQPGGELSLTKLVIWAAFFSSRSCRFGSDLIRRCSFD